MSDKVRDNKVTFTDFCRIVIKKIKIVIVVTLLIAILAVCYTGFYLNKNLKKYSISYDYQYPNIASGKYPDGQTFRYDDCILLDALLEIKASNADFSSIDVEKMYSGEALQIVKNLNNVDVGGKVVAQYNYVLTASSTYFSGKDQATAFLKAIANYPMELVISRLEKADAHSNLKAYESAQTYEEKLEFLDAQQAYLKSSYNSLISEYGEHYEFEGSTLKDKLTEVTLAYSELEKEALKANLESNGYIYGDVTDSLQILNMKKDKLLKEKEDSQSKLDSLKSLLIEISSSTNSNISFTEIEGELAKLIIRSVEIERELETINQQIAETRADPEQTGFTQRIEDVCSRLTVVTNDFENVRKDIYSNETKTYFNYVNAKESGTISLFVVGAASVVVGFIVVCFGVCLLEYFKKIYLEIKEEK